MSTIKIFSMFFIFIMSKTLILNIFKLFFGYLLLFCNGIFVKFIHGFNFLSVVFVFTHSTDKKDDDFDLYAAKSNIEINDFGETVLPYWEEFDVDAAIKAEIKKMLENETEDDRNQRLMFERIENISFAIGLPFCIYWFCY